MILKVYVSTTVLLQRYLHRLHVTTIDLQAHSLQVKSQDAVHKLGSQCVYISEILKHS